MFDYDETIILNSAGPLLAQEINKLRRFKNWEHFEKSQKLLRDGYTSFHDAISKLTDLLAVGIKGLDTSSMKIAISALEKRIIVRDGFGRLYRHLRDRNYTICLLTSSPHEATVPLTKQFPFDKVFSLQLRVAGMIYTGRHEGPMTSEKKKLIVDREIVPNNDFVFGVGNSYEDMLSFQSLDARFMFDNISVSSVQDLGFVKIRSFNELIEMSDNLG